MVHRDRLLPRPAALDVALHERVQDLAVLVEGGGDELERRVRATQRHLTDLRVRLHLLHRKLERARLVAHCGHHNVGSPV